MIPVVPNQFASANACPILDTTRINENFLALASDLTAMQEKRYTHSVVTFPLDGLMNTSAIEERRFNISTYTGRKAEIVGAQFVIYAATGATWTLSCSNTAFDPVSVAAAGATVEAFSNSPDAVPVDTTNVTFTVSANAASTITRGYIVFFIRTDRFAQGTTILPYTPTLLSAAEPLGEAGIIDQLNSFEVSHDADAAASLNLRCMVFAVRNLTAGASKTWRVPGGRLTKSGIVAYGVGGTTQQAQIVFGGVFAGTLNMVTGSTVKLTQVSDVAFTDDPTNSANDKVVTVNNLGGTTIGLVYIILWLT